MQQQNIAALANETGQSERAERLLQERLALPTLNWGQGQDQGYMFLCNRDTVGECMGGLFGAPRVAFNGMASVIQPFQTPLFLYNVDAKQVHGPFVATGAPGMNLEPQAFRQSCRKFPAQVRVQNASQIWGELWVRDFTILRHGEKVSSGVMTPGLVEFYETRLRNGI